LKSGESEVLGYLADLIKTVSYGNEYLNHGGNFNSRILRLMCNPIFKDGEFGSKVILARGVDGWYSYLKEGGCKSIRIFYKESDDSYLDSGFYHVSIDICKSVEWIIETIYGGYSGYFESNWFSKWGWNGDYFRTSCNQPIIDKQQDMEKVRENLDDKLCTISTFAYESGSGFAEYFRDNIKILDSHCEEPNSGNGLIVEKNYGQLARRVFNAAATSWCFNGMGSWADCSYSSMEINKKRDQLTKDLFFAVCDAYMYAINSY
jgi:hypothetical protein